MKGQLWIVAAPSGGGKTSLIAEMIKRIPKVSESISHTTRPARPAEVHGQHYFFVDKDEFNRMIANQEFLEYAQVYNNFYGTSALQVEKQLADGYDVVLNIDWQGALQILQQRPETRSVFLLPPSLSALEQRLLARAQDKSEVICERMREASLQISQYHHFEFVIINDDFQRAADELESLLRSARLLRTRCENELDNLLQKLQQEALKR